MQISGVTIQGGVNLIPPGAGAGGGAPSVSFGYSSGGYAPTSTAPTYVDNIIQKFSFSSDGNATDVGDLTVGRKQVSGQSSSVSGYTSGGMTGIPSPDDRSIIDKFPFASDGNATDVGDLTIFFRGYGRIDTSGQSSADNGYVSGGSSNNHEKSVDKFPFASDANATDMGDLIETLKTTAGQSSADNGYVSGGKNASAGSIDVNIIQKFPFASDSNATDVGDLTLARDAISGQSSTTYGYASGGSPNVNIIDKFPFASDSDATDVGDLLNTKGNGSGQSSSVSGYVTGGGGDPSSWNMIQKFSFTTDGNSTDVGDLLGTSFSSAGQQG
jgi:hypothetical protein